MMFRLTAYVLAAFAIVSFSVAEAQAGNRHERRIHNHQKNHHYKKHQTFRMRDVNAESRHNGDRRFTRSTLSFQVDGDRRHRFRHRHGHRFNNRVRVNAGSVVIVNVDGNRPYRLPVYRTSDVNTYSGDVDIYSVPGVGSWSYGVSSSERTVITSAPSARIIDVSRLKPNGACDMQAGVCVIKP